jgi:uncharacterized protein YjbI with pentapeptide repeats
MERTNEKPADAKSAGAHSWALREIGGKPLFDWLGLIAQGAVPIFLAILAWVQTGIATTRNEQEKQRAEEKAAKDKEIAKDNQMQAIMAGYLTQMTNLILREDLQRSDKDSKAAIMARAITLNASRQLDEDRKGQLLKFLYEASLIGRCLRDQQQEYECKQPILDLSGIKLDATTFDRPIPLLGVDLTGASLPKANLVGIDLARANMSRVNLTCADLTNSFLEKVDLESANLLSSKLAYATLPEAKLESALLQSANLKGANLERATLNGAVLQGANLQSAKLQDAQLGSRFLSNGKSHATDLEEADLGRANLQRANLENANLTGANLIGANLTGANLTGANFKNALYSQETKFPGSFNPKQKAMLDSGQHSTKQHLTKRFPEVDEGKQCELP